MAINLCSVLKPIASALLVILLLQHIKIAISKPSYSPADAIFVNCGSTGKTATPDGRKWTGDVNSKFGPTDGSNSSKSVSATALLQGSSVSYVPYMTARISHSQFSYTFNVTAGQKFIRLYFYPSAYDGGFNNSKAFFDVKTGIFTLLQNFSASLYASSYGRKAFFREFCLNVENQQMNLTFAPTSESYAFINGIEIVSMPVNLYHTPPEIQGLKFIGEREQFYVGNDTALEKIYRFNVGGSTISSGNDSGNMYRLWDADAIIAKDRGSVNDGLGLSLNYSRIPAYVAPDDVYLTARDMEVHNTNLSWVLSVDRGFKYLVRLHFCEFDEEIKINQRRFDILIDNQKANMGFDVIQSSGGKLTPMYNDYIVATGKNKGEVGYDYSLTITLWNDSFLNGLEVFKLNDSNGNLARPSPFLSVSPTASLAHAGQISAITIKKFKTENIMLIAFGGSLMIIFLLGCLLAWQLGMKKGSSGTPSPKIPEELLSVPVELCRCFSLEEIEEATNKFDARLVIGVGRCGRVYKGTFENGAMLLAIKRLNRKSRQRAQLFNTEMEMLSKLRHVNLVSLRGYCTDGGEMIIIYDYMINGTLGYHLYEGNQIPLDWNQRLQICIETARGLHYLHAGASQTVVHWNITSSNILFDENWVAKVSDFGLSTTKSFLKVLDPDCGPYRPLTVKSDVYSFGVLLFEVICGRKAVDQDLDVDEVNLVNWARKCIENGVIDLILDRRLKGKISPQCFSNFVEIAGKCVRDRRFGRPSMYEVIEKLEFAMELQKAADSEMEKMDPGGEYDLYPQALFLGSECGNIFDGFELDLDSLLQHKLTRKQHERSNYKSSRRTTASSLPQGLYRRFLLQEIKEATYNFDENLIIGQGGYGKVYVGGFDNRDMICAIKRLNPESRQGDREFVTETAMLSQLRHVNLVSLIGYCIEDSEMIIIYDYMTNGTLQDHLYGHYRKPLEWKKRLEICIGAARGIHYLHDGALRTVIHRDLKSSNILLDENWVAKVTDFGLSMVGVNNEAISTLVKGTFGYLDPEYARRGQITEKSDVYSFGVVMFEVLCARKPLDRNLVEEEMHLVNWARKCIQTGNVYQMVDPELIGKISPDCFKKFVEIAENCVCDQGIERPSMHEVMERLQFVLELQEAADAEMEKTSPGCQYVYPQESFPTPPSPYIPQESFPTPRHHTNVSGDLELDSTSEWDSTWELDSTLEWDSNLVLDSTLEFDTIGSTVFTYISAEMDTSTGLA